MALVAKRRMTETWTDALRRVAEPAGRAEDCLAAFSAARAAGAPEHEAAFRALESLGLLERVELPGDPAARPQSET